MSKKGSIEGVKDKDIISTIEEYNILASAIAPSRFRKIPDSITLMRKSSDWRNFEGLVKFLQDNKYDASEYIKSTMKHLLTWKNVKRDRFYVVEVISKKMRERYAGLSYKTTKVEPELKKLDKETEDYIEMIKRKVKRGWGEEKGNLIIKYHLKDWEENIRETNRRIAL